MARIILLNKPFQVMSQFRASGTKRTLAEYIHDPRMRVAGRLDYDSEGLLLLTDDGQLLQQITHPRYKAPKTYWTQVEGQATKAALAKLCSGIELRDGPTRPAHARIMAEPEALWARTPPIRYRANIPTSWIELTISEGRNRQVRRMTAAVGLPTLRLIRVQVGQWRLGTLQPGQLQTVDSPA